MKLIIYLTLFALTLASASIAQDNPTPRTDARKAADAIQDKNYADAVNILGGDTPALKTIKSIDTIAANDPKFTPDLLLHLKATAQFQLKNYVKAESTCDLLIKNHPKSPWIYKAIFLKAKTHSARQDYEKALAIYEAESTRLFATDRKAEIARSLMKFAETFTPEPAPNEIGTTAPDYAKAYKLYAEVLDLDCGHALRADARFQMTRMRSLARKFKEAEKEALAYLKEFDPTWRGLIGSPERVTMKKNATALATGKQIAEVRMLHAVALHRLNRRPEADNYLFELIKLIQSDAISAGKALLADATWLRLQTLRKKGGSAYDMAEWKREALHYLKNYPDHIHANRTAYMLGYLLNQHGKPAEAITYYQFYIENQYNTTIQQNPLTKGKESATEFETRKKLANTHLESAHFAIGQIQLNQGHFGLARKAWSETAKLFPNGAKWADCQKGLVEIDHAQLLHQLKELKKATTTINELDQAKKADELIASFITRHPLDPRIAGLLLQSGMTPYERGQELAQKSATHTKERQTQLYHHAIRSWTVLLSKYSTSDEAMRAKFLTATLWEEHFMEMEKAIDLYQSSTSTKFRTRLAALTSKRLLASSEHTFKLSEAPQITLNTRNIEKVQVHQYWLDLESYFLKNGNLQQATRLDVDLVEPDHTWEITIKDYKKHHPITQKIDIPFPKGKPGVCIIKIENEQFFTTSLVMRSDIDISVRTGKDEIIAYVTNWATGKPAAHVKILLASGEKIISTETTGQDGVMRKKLPALKDLSQLRILAISPDGAATCQQSLNGTWSPQALKPKAWLHTATTDNRPGSTVKLYGVVRDAIDGAYTLPKNADYTLTCRTRGRHAIFQTPIKLDAQGGFETTFKIPNKTTSRSVFVTLSPTTSDKSATTFSHHISISHDTPPLANLQISFDREHVKMGDVLLGEITATYRWGAPVSQRRIRVILPSGQHTDVTSDTDGKATFSYDTTGIASGAALTFTAKLIDVSSASSMHTLVVDPLQLYIQAESDKALVTMDEGFTIKVTTRDAQQKAIAAQLTLKLIKSEADDALPTATQATQATHRKETVVQTIEINTDAETGKGQSTLKIAKEGLYILRIEGTDPQGKPSLTETSITVLGENTHSALTAYHHTQELFDDGAIDLLVFSKLKSNTQAILTIEADEILSHQIITLTPGSNKVPLKLTPRHAPVFRASIMCMHERKFYSTEDVITVSRKLHLTTKLLQVKNNRAETGATVELEVNVTDAAGTPVPALLMTTLNPHFGQLPTSQTLLNHANQPVRIFTPFQRANALPVYSMCTSCGFTHTGTQGRILAALKEEEKRLELGSDHAHRVDDLSRLAQQHFQKVDQVRKLLYQGEGNFNLGKYSEAGTFFTKVLRIDPYNKSARRWIERVSDTQTNYNSDMYDQMQLGQSEGFINYGSPIELPNQVGNISTAGLRSGDVIITRNSIDSILNNPNRAQIQAGRIQRNSIDFYLNNPQRKSTIRSNALSLARSSNTFQINPNRVNMPVFQTRRVVGNGMARNGADFITIPGIPSAPNSSVSNRAISGMRSTRFLASSPQKQEPSWASEIQLVTTGKLAQKIPLPNKDGNWKLTVLAAGPTGRLGIDTHHITTSSPLTLKFSEISEVMAKDTFAPQLTLYRNNAEKEASYDITGHIALGEKTLQKIQQTVTLKENQSSLVINLPSITAPATGDLFFFAKIESDGKKHQDLRLISIRPYGVPVARRHSQPVAAGTTSFDLKLQDKAVPHHLNIRARKDIDTTLLQLATEPSEPIFGWRIPCRAPHPAGQFLAQVAVLEYLAGQNAKESDTYQNLLEQTKWTLNELIELQHADGSWSAVLGRKRSSLLTTTTAYEALQRWKKLINPKDTQDTKVLSTAKTAAWLKKQLTQLNNQESDTRCLIQQSLSYGKFADFSICNRLYRDRGSLGDAGRALLAQTFINLERPAFAKTLIEGMQTPEKWTSNADPITRHPAWLAGRSLSVLATLAKADPSLKKKADVIYQTILTHAGSGGFTNDFVRGAAVAGLAAWTQQTEPSDFTAEIFINGSSVGKIVSDQPKTFDDLDFNMLGIKLTPGTNTIKTVMQGKGKLCLSATLTGFLPEFPKQDNEKFAISNRHYYHEQPTFKGQPLKASGRSVAKESEFQKIIRVYVELENQIKSQQEVALIEQIPAGFSYLKGSLEGSHSGARIENNQLIITFRDNFKPRWIHYSLIASHAGTWNQVPSTMFPIDAPEKAVFGDTGSLTILPPGKKSSEPYKMTYLEHRELAALHFQHGENKQALTHLAALRKLSKQLNEDAGIARITLWLETAKKKPETPNAKLLVESFETLNARMPDLSIPFDKILKVGQAYRELKEFERGHYVFEATLEAGFAQDTYVGAALEDQGRFLDAIDYQKSIWQLYPDNGEITNTWFAMAQEVYSRSSKARSLKPRITDPKDTKIKETDLIKASQQMLDQFLYLHPEHPSADDVSYTMANTLFALKDYQGVVAHARRCHKRYPKSNYLSSFRYMEALGSFWLRDYDVAIKAASEVAQGDSQDKNLATFITAQIFHAKGQPAKAMEWYRPIKDQYPDARESIAYFEQKKITLDEVKVLPSGQKATITMKYRNIKQAQLKIYRVDLMKLYLKQKNLSNITNIELAGIAPKHELTVTLPQGDMTEDLEKSITLPLKKDGAYLILCRGDYLYTSGLVLITPLKLEVQEEPHAGSLRVHIKDRTTGKLLDNVHVKAIGSTDHTFRQGETDLRGIWKAEKLTGKPTVIARDTDGRYAFFRSTRPYHSQEKQSDDDAFAAPKKEGKASQKIDFNDNLMKGQKVLDSRNYKSYNEFRRTKGKGVKVNKAMKK